uniref:Transmembrane protein 80 n=1 Tax=Hucho hucho TaxID=62062 RepID=A0A4W5NM83_9TELE
MPANTAGKSAVVLSSVPLQLLLYLTALYYVFYFLSTLCMIICKSRVLSYPDDLLTQDVGLLFFMAGLELLRLYCVSTLDPVNYSCTDSASRISYTPSLWRYQSINAGVLGRSEC